MQRSSTTTTASPKALPAYTPYLIPGLILDADQHNQEKVNAIIQTLNAYKNKLDLSGVDFPLITIAAKKNLPTVVSELIKLGANPCQVDEGGQSAAGYALGFKDKFLIKAIVNAKPLSLENFQILLQLLLKSDACRGFITDLCINAISLTFEIKKNMSQAMIEIVKQNSTAHNNEKLILDLMASGANPHYREQTTPYEKSAFQLAREKNYHLTDEMIRHKDFALHADYDHKSHLFEILTQLANTPIENIVLRKIYYQTIRSLIAIAKKNSATTFNCNEKKDDQGNTALHLAVLNNDEELAEFLLTNGANPHLKNNANATPLSIAMTNVNNVMLTDILIKKSSTATKGIGIAMGVAVNQNNPELLKHLAAKGTPELIATELNKPNNRNQDRPIHAAAQHGNPYTTLLLMEHGADPHLKNAQEKSAFELAVEKHPKLALAMAKHKNFRKPDNFRRLAGKCIVAHRNELAQAILTSAKEELTRLHYTFLLDIKKHIGSENYTRLHLAAALCDPDAIRDLVKAGQNQNTETTHYKTTLLFVIFNKGNIDESVRQQCIDNILASSSKFTGNMSVSITAAACQNDTDLVKKLINKAIEDECMEDVVNFKRCFNLKMPTPLYYAIKNKNCSMIDALLDANYNPHKPFIECQTAFDFAISTDIDIAMHIVKHKNFRMPDDLRKKTVVKLILAGHLDLAQALHPNKKPIADLIRSGKMTRLHALANLGDVSAVQELLNKDKTINPYALNDSKRTVIDIIYLDENITRDEKIAGIKVILDSAFPVDVSIVKIMHAALRINDNELFNLLFNKICTCPADVIKQILEWPDNQYQDTLAHAAAIHSINTDAINRLILLGANLTTSNKQGKNAFELACLHRDNDEMAVMMMNHRQFKLPNNYVHIILVLLSESNIDFAIKIIAKACKPGQSAFEAACEACPELAVAMMKQKNFVMPENFRIIAAGCVMRDNVELADSILTFMHDQSFKKNTDIFEDIKASASVKEKMEIEKFTKLHIVTRLSDVQSVRTLIQGGFDFNTKNLQQIDALTSLIYRNKLIPADLRRNMIDEILKSMTPFTALTMATCLASLIKEDPTNFELAVKLVDRAMHDHVLDEALKNINVEFKNQLDTVVDKNINTLLHHYTMNNELSIAVLLRQHGMSEDTLNSQNMSPKQITEARPLPYSPEYIKHLQAIAASAPEWTPEECLADATSTSAAKTATLTEPTVKTSENTHAKLAQVLTCSAQEPATQVAPAQLAVSTTVPASVTSLNSYPDLLVTNLYTPEAFSEHDRRATEAAANPVATTVSASQSTTDIPSELPVTTLESLHEFAKKVRLSLQETRTEALAELDAIGEAQGDELSPPAEPLDELRTELETQASLDASSAKVTAEALAQSNTFAEYIAQHPRSPTSTYPTGVLLPASPTPGRTMLLEQLNSIAVPTIELSVPEVKPEPKGRPAQLA